MNFKILAHVMATSSLLSKHKSPTFGDLDRVFFFKDEHASNARLFRGLKFLLTRRRYEIRIS